jgi:hypothetical protein
MFKNRSHISTLEILIIEDMGRGSDNSRRKSIMLTEQKNI